MKKYFMVMLFFIVSDFASADIGDDLNTAESLRMQRESLRMQKEALELQRSAQEMELLQQQKGAWRAYQDAQNRNLQINESVSERERLALEEQARYLKSVGKPLDSKLSDRCPHSMSYYFDVYHSNLATGEEMACYATEALNAPKYRK